MAELNDSRKEFRDSAGNTDILSRENLLSTKLPEAAVSKLTLSLLPVLELEIPFAKADSPDTTKDLAKSLDALTKLNTPGNLKVKQNQDGSYNINGAVDCTIRPNGDIVKSGNKPDAKIEGKASVDESGNLVLDLGGSKKTIQKDGTVVSKYKSEHPDYDDEANVTTTKPAHGKFQSTEYDWPDKNIKIIDFAQVPDKAVKVDDNTSVEFKPKEKTISITDGTTTWKVDHTGDVVVTKDGKSETLDLMHAKFKDSGLRCGGGTYTFPDGTEIFFKNGHISSLKVKTDNGTIQAAYPTGKFGTDPSVTVMKRK